MTDGSASARRRLTSGHRRAEIIEKAVLFFAEDGLDSSTRRFAQHIGITQPLLYRYFASKDDLIEEVYNAVYLNRWQDDWNRLIRDPTIPVRERLNRFYSEYTDVIYNREWLRIYLYSGLRGAAINRRYMKLVRQRILEPIVTVARTEAGLPAVPPRPDEVEFAWVMHGGIFYFGVRDKVYGTCVYTGKKRMIMAAVDAFLHGITSLEAVPLDPDEVPWTPPAVDPGPG